MPQDVALIRDLGRGHVPVLGGLAAGPAARPRPGEPGRARLLRPAGRRAAGQRHRAVGDAVPLGPAAGARGRGRLAGPGHRVPVRRLRDAGLRRAAGPGQDLDHAERAVVLGDARLRLRRARPGPAGLRRRHRAPCTTCCSATAWPPSGCGRRPSGRHEFGITLNMGTADPADRQRRRPRRGPPRRRAGHPHLPGPAGARPVPGGRRRRPGRAGHRAARPGRRPGDHLDPDRRARRQLLLRRDCLRRRRGRQRPTTPTACRSAGPSRRTARSPRWTGRSSPRASPSCWCGCTATTRAADRHHRERRRVRRRARRDRLRRRRRPGRLLRLAHRRGRRGPRSRAPTSAATSPGR